MRGRNDSSIQIESVGYGSSFPAVRANYPVPELASASDDSVRLNELTALLWRRKGTIAAAALLGVLIGIGISVLTPPVYRARSSVQLEGFSDDQLLHGITSISPVLPNATPENYLQNQVKLLESETLARRVADKLGIQAQDNPPSGVGALIAHTRNQFSFLRPWQLTPDERRIKKVKDALTVRTSLQSQVMEIFYDAPDPRLAARGANLATSEFMDLNREARTQLVQDTTEWLSKQASELKARLESLNQQLQQFARSAGLVFAGKQSTLAEDRMRQIQDALSRAEADRATKQSRYEAATSSGVGDFMSDAVGAGPLRQYQTDLQTMRRELAQLRTVYQPTYYKVERLEAQIAETEKAIENERKEIAGRMRSEYTAASRLENLLSEAQQRQLQTVEQQMDKERQYNVRQSEIDTTQKLYDSMLEKVKEAGAASALRTTNVRLIDPAIVPSVPYSPNKPLNMAIGFAIGTLGGIGLIFMRERSGKVRRPGESALVEVHELGVIPSAKDSKVLDLPLPARGLMGLRPIQGDLGLVTHDQDTSLLSESFRSALTSILFSSRLDGNVRNRLRGRVLTLTSVHMMEGKTTVLSNLGIAAAERKRRVLLIDGDLRRPRLHQIFDVSNDWGLSDALQRSDSGEFLENAPLDALAQPTRIPNLWVLPSGPGTGQIASLLHSADLDVLLRRLRRDFDLIFIDTPPLMLCSDARVLGRLSDGLVMVVRANARSREELKTAYLQLMQDQIAVLGTILNDWRMDSDQSRAYRRYYRDYQRRPGIPA